MGFPNLGQPAPAEPEKKKRKSRGSGERQAAVSSNTESQKRVRGLFAVLFALLAGALVFNSLTANQSKGNVFVLRAASTILPLTSINENQLEAVQLPVEAVEAGVLKAATAEAVLAAAKTGNGTTVVGRYALYPILAHQQIRLKSMLTTDAQLATPLSEAERLVTINIPLARGVSGLVRTGDHVDVFSVNSDGEAQLLVENVEVVLAAPAEDVLRTAGAANPESDPLTRIPDYPVPAMYVVRVPSALVNILVSADSSSKMYLTYRSAVPGTQPACTDGSATCTSTTSTTIPPTQTTAPKP
jgi:Flp pilus assembly protein CpaB